MNAGLALFVAAIYGFGFVMGTWWHKQIAPRRYGMADVNSVVIELGPEPDELIAVYPAPKIHRGSAPRRPIPRPASAGASSPGMGR